MVKHLLTLACATAALSVGATPVVDYTIDYSTYTEFPFYVMGYTPTFADGVMKASYPGEWYQFFAADGYSLNSAYTYTVTVKVKSSKAGSIGLNVGWGWGDGEQINSSMNVTTEWSEQSVDFHNVGTASGANVVVQPGTFDGDLEFAWLKVSHEDTSLDPALQCMIADNLPQDATLNAWDCCAQYNFPSAVEAGTYTLKYDVYGLENGTGAIWGTVSDAGWYGGGDFDITANKWTTVSKTFTTDGPMTMLQFVFGGKYKGKTLYFDNISLTKEGSTENLIENSDFKTADLGHWSRPSWLKYDLFVGNGPANTLGIGEIEADANAASAYYNLQGLRMPEGNLPAGIYIKVTGSKAEKVAIR